MSAEMTNDEMLAREGIRKTIAQYTDAGDNGRYEDLIPCYAEDGIFEVAIGKWQGRVEIENALRTLRSKRDAGSPLLQRHHLGTCWIDILDETHARAITYFTVISQCGLDHAGRYLDKLVKRDGRWQFAHRNVIVEWRNEASGFVATKADAQAFEVAAMQAGSLS
jgi:hypothetical protein